MEGKELRAIRKKMGLTQKQLAEKIGITWNTLARWERGELGIREPISRLIRILDETSGSKRKE